MTAGKIKVILFDMGGVLIKTVDRQVRTDLAKRFGMTYEELEKLVYNSETAMKASIGEIPEEEHFEVVLKTLDAQEFGIDPFQEAFWGGDRLDEDLVAFIVAKQGQYRFGMLSNATSNIRRWLTMKYNFLHLFTVVFFSAEQKMIKPNAEFYQAILKEFNVKPEEAVFVDDFIENVEAARALGIHAIHYRSTPQVLAELEAVLASE